MTQNIVHMKKYTTEELIWRYLDGESTDRENAQIKSLLAADESFRMAFDEAKTLHETLGQSKLMTAPEEFVELAMQQISQPAIHPAYHAISSRPLWLFLAMVSFLAIYSVVGPVGGAQLDIVSDIVNSLAPYTPSLELDLSVIPHIQWILIVLVAIPSLVFFDSQLSKYRLNNSFLLA